MELLALYDLCKILVSFNGRFINTKDYTTLYTHFTHTVKPLAGGGGNAPKEKFCCPWQSPPLPLSLVPCLATGLYKVWPFTNKRSPIQRVGVLQLVSYFSHHPFRTLHDGIKAFIRESFSLGHNVILMLKGYLIYSVSILLQFAFNFCFRFGDIVRWSCHIFIPKWTWSKHTLKQNLALINFFCFQILLPMSPSIISFSWCKSKCMKRLQTWFSHGKFISISVSRPKQNKEKQKAKHCPSMWGDDITPTCFKFT